MNRLHYKQLAVILTTGLLAAGCTATDNGHHGHAQQANLPTVNENPQVCDGFGPQTPRDIDNVAGENKRIFSIAPKYQEMNLCNIHFHANAEHKAKDFSIFAGEGDDHGIGGGYQCNISTSLSAAQRKPLENNMCSGVNSGDTIEVHWVHSSCDVKPGKGLGSCFSANDDCANPQLRVETQVFTVVNDSSAMNFNDFVYGGNMADGYHQAKAIPDNTGVPIEFTGSTTGPSYNSQCSNGQVSWRVRPQCAKVDINSLSQWCASGNVFEETGAHGVRVLVTNPKLLSEIQ